MPGHLRTALVAAVLALAAVAAPVLDPPAGAATAARSAAQAKANTKAKTVVTGWGTAPVLVRLASPITITVQVRTASTVAARYVVLQRRQAGTTTWHTVTSILTTTGSAQVHILPSKLGNWQFRVTVPATAKANSTTTAPRLFQVTRTGRPALDMRTATLLQLVNHARSQTRKCGSTTYRAVAPLTYNASLERSASGWASYLAGHNKFAHVIGGSTPTSRATTAGYHGGAGENLAGGFDTPAAVMTAWLNSPDHCANIMDKRYQDLGVGYAYAANSTFKTYWLQDFGIRY